MKPYVVSSGIEQIIKMYCKERGFICPQEAFFSKMSLNLKKELRKVFQRVEIISHEEIEKGIKKILGENLELEVVSLDRVYIDSKLNLDLTRKVTTNGTCVIGNRASTPPIEEQFTIIREANVKKIILVDDVLFSGGTLLSVMKRLRTMEVEVLLVVVGIAIGEGVDEIGQRCKVEYVKKYHQVIDEICEWDFYPGVPFSGRLTHEGCRRPYCAPFGDIVSWASSQEQHKQSFSEYLIKESIALFEEIERINNREISYEEIGYLIEGVSFSKEERFVGILKKYLQK